MCGYRRGHLRAPASSEPASLSVLPDAPAMPGTSASISTSIFTIAAKRYEVFPGGFEHGVLTGEGGAVRTLYTRASFPEPPRQHTCGTLAGFCSKEALQFFNFSNCPSLCGPPEIFRRPSPPAVGVRRRVRISVSTHIMTIP
jgi:hypothetical protein